jgi:hypothetical protein
MTHDDAIAEARRLQALDPDAKLGVAAREGEWTVVRIVQPDVDHRVVANLEDFVVASRTQPPPAANQAARSRLNRLSSRSGIWGGPPAAGWR